MVGTVIAYLKKPVVLSSLICGFLIFSGLIKVKTSNPYKSAIAVEQINTVYGTICSNPVKISSGKFYMIDLDIDKVEKSRENSKIEAEGSGIIKVLLPSEIVESVYPGKLYSLTGKKILAEKGENIICQGNWSKNYMAFIAQDIKALGHQQGIIGQIVHLRAICRLIFKRLLFSWGAAGGLILSLLSGSREYTEESIAKAFKNAGLSHILALSGMHLSFFSGVTGNFGKRVFGIKSLVFFKILGIVFFIWFAGLSPSLFRALLCAIIIILAKSVYCININMIEVLCAAFLIHCVCLPNDIQSAAFMLSYASLLGILLFSSRINRHLCPLMPACISNSLSASIGAQTATAPISLSLFGTIMPIGIIASLVISPMVTIFLTTSLIAILLGLFLPFLSPAFGAILNIMYTAISLPLSFFACVPPITFR